jgi:hypothetical protein
MGVLEARIESLHHELIAWSRDARTESHSIIVRNRAAANLPFIQ